MDNKDKSEIIFDPTTKLKDEILENDRKYLESSKVVPFGHQYLGIPWSCDTCMYATYSSSCKGCHSGSNYISR